MSNYVSIQELVEIATMNPAMKWSNRDCNNSSWTEELSRTLYTCVLALSYRMVVNAVSPKTILVSPRVAVLFQALSDFEFSGISSINSNGSITRIADIGKIGCFDVFRDNEAYNDFLIMGFQKNPAEVTPEEAKEWRLIEIDLSGISTKR